MLLFIKNLIKVIIQYVLKHKYSKVHIYVCFVLSDTAALAYIMKTNTSVTFNGSHGDTVYTTNTKNLYLEENQLIRKSAVAS